MEQFGLGLQSTVGERSMKFAALGTVCDNMLRTGLQLPGKSGRTSLTHLPKTAHLPPCGLRIHYVIAVGIKYSTDMQ